MAKGTKEIEKDIEKHFGFVPEFIRTMPEPALPGAWSLQRDVELGESAIPNKYKELIGLAVAAHIKCRYCIYFHTKAARLHGATDEELREAIAMSGLTALFSNQITGMQTDLDSFKREVDRAVDYVVAHSPEAHAPH